MAVGTTKKSSATKSLRWLSRNAATSARAACGAGAFTSQPSTRPRRCPAWPVRCGCGERPRLRSPATSSGSGSRHPEPARDSPAVERDFYGSRNAGTRPDASGSPSQARASLQPVQPCERTTQKPRSHFPRSRRRSPRVWVSTPICCRSARFSSASSRRVLNSDLIAPRRARTSSHTNGTVAAQAHAVQAHPRGWGFR